MNQSKAKYSARSMTAFSRIQTNSEYGRFSWEVRSVNQRYLEINPRLPDAFRHLENDLRQTIKQQIHRGKLDVSLSFESSTQQTDLQVNNDILQPLTEAISQVQQGLPEATQVNPLEILKWPGILLENDASQQEKMDAKILQKLNDCLKQLTDHRDREGQALAVLIMERSQSIHNQLKQLEPALPEVLKEQTDKLKIRIHELSEQLDENRFNQEVAILAQKMDVAEEIDRLYTHLKEVEHILTKTENHAPIGRRLDFLMQELNREANTLGSKAADQRISQASVELKVLIEQMREQVQNIE